MRFHIQAGARVWPVFLSDSGVQRVYGTRSADAKHLKECTGKVWNDFQGPNLPTFPPNLFLYFPLMVHVNGGQYVGFFVSRAKAKLVV